MFGFQTERSVFFSIFRCAFLIWKSKQGRLDGWSASSRAYLHLHYSFKWNMHSPEEFQQVYLFSRGFSAGFHFNFFLFRAIGVPFALNRMKLHLYLYFPQYFWYLDRTAKGNMKTSTEIYRFKCIYATLFFFLEHIHTHTHNQNSRAHIALSDSFGVNKYAIWRAATAKLPDKYEKGMRFVLRFRLLAI